MGLLAAEDVYRDLYALPGVDVPGHLLAYEHVHRRYEQQAGMPPLPAGDVEGPWAVAFVNRGRWVAFCPFGCGSAQVVSREDRRFYCCGPGGCFNTAVGNRTVPVVWPDDDQVDAVDRLLAQRPLPNQNWYVGEPLENLVEENERYGVAA